LGPLLQLGGRLDEPQLADKTRRVDPLHLWQTLLHALPGADRQVHAVFRDAERRVGESCLAHCVNDGRRWLRIVGEPEMLDIGRLRRERGPLHRAHDQCRFAPHRQQQQGEREVTLDG
jgi:hypothetical protein